MSPALFSEKYVGKKNYDRPMTRGGYFLDEVRSSIQKMIRRRKEEECFFWGYELYDSGMWRYLVRILVTVAGEDIGMANPQAMNLCMTSYLYFEHLAKQKGEKKKFKCKNCGHIEESKGFYQPHWNELGLLISYLCHSKKSRHIDYVTSLTDEKRKRGWKLEVDMISKDCHTFSGKQRLKEKGLDGDREFYSVGAKVINHKYFDKKYEKEIKGELMKLINLNDLVQERDELSKKHNDKI